MICLFFFQAEDGIRDWSVTGVQTCALPIWGLIDFDGMLLLFIMKVLRTFPSFIITNFTVGLFLLKFFLFNIVTYIVIYFNGCLTVLDGCDFLETKLG